MVSQLWLESCDLISDIVAAVLTGRNPDEPDSVCLRWAICLVELREIYFLIFKQIFGK